MEFNDSISDSADKLMSQWWLKELIIKGEHSDEHTSTAEGSWFGLGYSSFSSLYQAQQIGVLYRRSLERNLCVALLIAAEWHRLAGTQRSL